MQIRSVHHSANDSMAPVASPRAPAPLLARQAVFSERRRTLVNDSPLQSSLNKLTRVTQDDNKMTSSVNLALID